jgi:dienelactone hydrolase
MDQHPGLFEELKRRKVFRVSAMYAVFGWLALQIGEVTFEPLGLPEDSLRTLIFVVATGFPIAVALGWFFDWTSQGPVSAPQDSGADRADQRRVSRTRWMGVSVALAASLIGYGVYRGYGFWSDVRWAQDVAQPELVRLVELNDFRGAFELATRLEGTLGEMPALEPVWSLIAAEVHFETEPSGAKVSYRDYEDPTSEWKLLGETPIAPVRVPRGPSLWRIEKPGYVSRHIARLPSNGLVEEFEWPSHFVLDSVESSAGDTVAVEGREYLQVPLGGFSIDRSFELDRFFLDRTEVRNDLYQEFVDAGGYRRPEFWKEPFQEGERLLEFEEARARFVDSTGRPGPATWIGGRYPEGKGAYPVGGVSWYEASAYARFRGRHLPTVYHWAAAALPDVEILEPLAPALAAQSNLESAGPMPVGESAGLSTAGAVDMFGNVAEWVSTERSDGHRFTLGLGWPDPAYNASLAVAASPWTRLPAQGFRLASYPAGEPAGTLLDPVEFSPVDYELLEPLSDEALTLLGRLGGGAKLPVQATEADVELPNGIQAIRVEIETPFSDQDLPLFLLLPENARPPYQVALWFGGINSIRTTDNETLYNADMRFSNFLRQSGRAVVMPIWTGTFERNDGSTFRRFMGSGAEQRDLGTIWARDMSLAIDYLESREDIDATRIAFVGLSLGSAMGAGIIPGEERLTTAILWSGGFAAASLEETRVLSASLARRTYLPVLMLNGRHDFIFPLENQRAYFRMLGTSDEHKRHVVYDAGHLGWPLGEFVRENLDWLDRYLGPVESAGG